MQNPIFVGSGQKPRVARHASQCHISSMHMKLPTVEIVWPVDLYTGGNEDREI